MFQGARIFGDTYLVDLDLLELVDDDKQSRMSGPDEYKEDDDTAEHSDDKDVSECGSPTVAEEHHTPSKPKPATTHCSNLFQQFGSPSTPGRNPNVASTDSEGSDIDLAEIGIVELIDSSDDDAEEERQEPETVPHDVFSPGKSEASAELAEETSKEEPPSTREVLFQEDLSFVMDAVKSGNVGRYLNHSCSPNIFIQNVFLESHDLRFPWLAFFAGTLCIEPGEELCWDYGYKIGAVPGKVLYCHCGSVDCAKRLQ
jgi:histone-lysine N-methyltransferase SETDB1